jgi:hypothetical protein
MISILFGLGFLVVGCLVFFVVGLSFVAVLGGVFDLLLNLKGINNENINK